MINKRSKLKCERKDTRPIGNEVIVVEIFTRVEVGVPAVVMSGVDDPI